MRALGWRRRRSCSAINAGFSAQDFTACAAGSPSFKRATRVENACATGSAAVHQGLNAIVSKSARFALIVGANDNDACRGDRQEPLKASYVCDEADIEGGSAGIFVAWWRSIFRNTAINQRLPARCQEPQERCYNPFAQMRKDWAMLRRRERQEPVRAGLLSAPTAAGADGAAPWCSLTRRRRAPWASRGGARRHHADFLPMARRDIQI
jgi:acetyl-CoA C-acetyltransferase